MDREAIVEYLVKSSDAGTLHVDAGLSSIVQRGTEAVQALTAEGRNILLTQAILMGRVPCQEMWLRGEDRYERGLSGFYASCTVSEVRLRSLTRTASPWMPSMPSPTYMGAVSEWTSGSANLIWVSSGHSWTNEKFDSMVSEASNLVGDDKKREQMFRDAQKILVDDVGGVFIAHHGKETCSSHMSRRQLQVYQTPMESLKHGVTIGTGVTFTSVMQQNLTPQIGAETMLGCIWKNPRTNDDSSL